MIYLMPDFRTAGERFDGFAAAVRRLQAPLHRASNRGVAHELPHSRVWVVLRPVAFGLIASLTLSMRWLAESERHLGNWKFVLPPLMLFLSFMMFSRFRYPSFKAIDWKTTKSVPRFLIISTVLVITAMNYEWMPAVLFLAYLLYGVLRPWLSRDWRREIEEEIGEEPSDEAAEQAR